MTLITHPAYYALFLITLIVPNSNRSIQNYVRLLTSCVARVGVIRGGNRRALQKSFDLLKMNNFVNFSLLHRKFNSSQKIPMTFF